MGYLSSIVFHSVILKYFEKRQELRNVDMFLCRGQRFEFLSSIVFHTHTENVLKRVKYREMWLRFFIEGKFGVSIISIVFHTVILKMLSKDARIKKCGFVSI